MVVLFNASYIEVINIKNLLSSFNIESYIENEYMATIKPSLLSAGGFNSVFLQVNEKDFENAKKILEDYKNGKFSLNS
ncbi:DUF2007 domain-containing protein [Flavobacterium sp. LHD-80]|uniref:putative signal transducing protein n=1 Tax=Flavobacterium sp. LHD-80 TaxID=3071411 RepID=UPI0027E136B3|nr:DUF2007 domain-containing protein [Flavobacterium sp. LHD-80]MDQ6469298.1 DUF2007 domain-containing protein [Flavobacterium sp. LHD-80]